MSIDWSILQRRGVSLKAKMTDKYFKILWTNTIKKKIHLQPQLLKRLNGVERRVGIFLENFYLVSGINKIISDQLV